jgi:hypothetical protein
MPGIARQAEGGRGRRSSDRSRTAIGSQGQRGCFHHHSDAHLFQCTALIIPIYHPKVGSIRVSSAEKLPGAGTWLHSTHIFEHHAQ